MQIKKINGFVETADFFWPKANIALPTAEMVAKQIANKIGDFVMIIFSRMHCKKLNIMQKI